ncbi:uncharacterized protein LACBIDRAFT_304129 [Laccaria bicolor S238N-H82]|uniref:Predicted protein n=1 Tax=Laccaria bicolor (strain S238N-H82 / ATCC MYA-4686) TaxID=486041 RepID=B0DL04_LACBS|nr:uncharacterized protein LACBIDRAFT_304129 [Laccaria bicolor S238N-H82]EDR04828.1 predicted protein [Laccaria bicolor S238N-H82]|eukprot:XP_001884652.1 predicted protein [Laccaria bicolor S238N-H82]
MLNSQWVSQFIYILDCLGSYHRRSNESKFPNDHSQVAYSLEATSSHSREVAYFCGCRWSEVLRTQPVHYASSHLQAWPVSQLLDDFSRLPETSTANQRLGDDLPQHSQEVHEAMVFPSFSMQCQPAGAHLQYNFYLMVFSQSGRHPTIQTDISSSFSLSQLYLPQHSQEVHEAMAGAHLQYSLYFMIFSQSGCHPTVQTEISSTFSLNQLPTFPATCCRDGDTLPNLPKLEWGVYCRCIC